MKTLGVVMGKQRVLVVDDYREIADALGRIVRRLGHEVRCVYTGLDAMVEAHRFVPHIVLLDLELPDVSGYVVARCLRAAQRPPYLAAISASSSATDLVLTFASGFDQHLAKPFGVDRLVALIGDYSGGSQ